MEATDILNGTLEQKKLKAAQSQYKQRELRKNNDLLDRV